MNIDGLWLACYVAGYPLTLIGMIVVYLWFKQFEVVCPAVFNLSHLPASSAKKGFQYWGYILGGSYKDLTNADIRFKCTFLRVFFWVYMVNFVFVALGIFILKP
jgi:hypothetical protein